jgi:hypothetical protein
MLFDSVRHTVCEDDGGFAIFRLELQYSIFQYAIPQGVKV